LHSAAIVHQDIKPSNVLVFDNNISKIGDFGRSACKDIASPHDDFPMPGDWHYAPPEQFYGYSSPEWNVRRLAADIYQFGSMIVFFFTNASMTSLLMSQMEADHLPGKWTGTFLDLAPYLRHAFGKALDKLGDDVGRIEPTLRDELVQIVRYLCDPDPTLRGHPLSGRGANQYSMERFVSRFDLLARRAEVRRLGGRK
jgi:serine/threonine protein kinase